MRLKDQPIARLFTPGPTPTSARVLAAGCRQLPYNRTADFSALTLEILAGLRRLFDTAGDVALLTSSGTGGMEAAVTNFVAAEERALAIDSGVFGRRWAELCQIHGIACDRLPTAGGESMPLERLEHALATGNYRVLFATAHETSTGVLHDIAAWGELARRYNVFFIVDGISTIAADPFHMDAWHVDVTVLSSQKALALPPGLSLVGIGPRARERMASVPPRSMYFRLADYLENQRRGQMPYTPAIGLFLMLHERLAEIDEIGLGDLIARHAERAAHFRGRLAGLPLELYARRPSNAITAVRCPSGLDASQIAAELAERRLFVAPNGGDLRNSVFRVGHMGEQSLEDLDVLVDALASIVVNCQPCSR
jgi:aspartate aminotransferase-like enzyme